MDTRQRLDSWKEISNYVNKSIKTCQAWEEKYGLPVYRIGIYSKKPSVFAYKIEVDLWFETISKSQRISSGRPEANRLNR